VLLTNYSSVCCDKPEVIAKGYVNDTTQGGGRRRLQLSWATVLLCIRKVDVTDTSVVCLIFHTADTTVVYRPQVDKTRLKLD